MSLLMNYNDQRFINIAQLIFEEQFRRDPKLESEMDERRKKLMYDNIIYNISFLMTSVYFSDGKIFECYARWLYELLCNLMKDLDRERIMDQLTDRYKIMSEILTCSASDILSKDEQKRATEYLNRAIQVTTKSVADTSCSSSFIEGEYYEIRKAYIEALLATQTKRAFEIVKDAKTRGLSYLQIYEEVLAKVMYEIGDLWHKNIITVDKEHYATSVTQTVMASFYEEIFERPRKNRILVSCAVGSELHELGIRMISDIFEYQGWDTYYLGAALPESALLKAIEEHNPDLVALSVTMPPYLNVCERLVKVIKVKYPDVRIAVGGQAFSNTDSLWDKWGVDFYSSKAMDLARWAEVNF